MLRAEESLLITRIFIILKFYYCQREIELHILNQNIVVSLAWLRVRKEQHTDIKIHLFNFLDTIGYVDSIHFTADWLLLGDLFCQAKNMKRKGMVMTAVVIKIGWNDVGSILIPKSCKKGSGKTVYIQKPAIIPKIILFRFRTERRLILFIFLRPHVMHFMVL